MSGESSSPSTASTAEKSQTVPQEKRPVTLVGRITGILVAVVSLTVTVYAIWLVAEPFISRRPKYVARGASFDQTGWGVYVEANLTSSEFTDADVPILRWSPYLTAVSLRNANVGDEAVATLSRLKHLKRLDLSGTNITDASLAKLASLPELEILHLTGTNVSDVGLAELAASPRLKVLSVANCPRLTSQGILNLARQNPQLAISGTFAGVDGLTPLDVRNLQIAKEFWRDNQPKGVRVNVGSVNSVEVPDFLTCLKLYMPEVIDEIHILPGMGNVPRIGETASTNASHRETTLAFKNWTLNLPNLKRIRITYDGPVSDELVDLMRTCNAELQHSFELTISNRVGDPTISAENLEFLFTAGLSFQNVTLVEPTTKQLEVLRKQQVTGLTLQGDFSETMTLEKISDWRSLQSLNLCDEFIAEADFAPLTAIKNLKYISLNCPQLDPDCAAKLCELLPRCRFSLHTRPIPPEVLERLGSLNPASTRYSFLQPIRPQDYTNLSDYGPWDFILRDIWGQEIKYSTVVEAELKARAEMHAQAN